MSHFKPDPRHQMYKPYSTNAERMESSKANFTTGLLVSETCIDKCSLSDASERISGPEGDCLRQCFVKYFEAQHVIRNETENFLRGQNIS